METLHIMITLPARTLHHPIPQCMHIIVQYYYRYPAVAATSFASLRDETGCNNYCRYCRNQCDGGRHNGNAPYIHRVAVDSVHIHCTCCILMYNATCCNTTNMRHSSLYSKSSQDDTSLRLGIHFFLYSLEK